MGRFITTCVLAASAAVVVWANHPATFVLRNGDRVNGDLSYKGGSAYTLNGRDYEAQDVAVVAFVNDDPSADELGRFPPRTTIRTSSTGTRSSRAMAG